MTNLQGEDCDYIISTQIINKQQYRVGGFSCKTDLKSNLDTGLLYDHHMKHINIIYYNIKAKEKAEYSLKWLEKIIINIEWKEKKAK